MLTANRVIDENSGVYVLEKADKNLDWSMVPSCVDLVVVDRISDIKARLFFRETALAPSVTFVTVALKITNKSVVFHGDGGLIPIDLNGSFDQAVINVIVRSYAKGYVMEKTNIHIDPNPAVRKLILSRPEYKNAFPTMDQRLAVPEGVKPVPVYNEMETFNYFRREQRFRRIVEYIGARRLYAWVPMREVLSTMQNLAQAHKHYLLDGNAADLDKCMDEFEKLQELTPIP